jgi:polyhydroxyalkanoate synthesis regulator phasin
MFPGGGRMNDEETQKTIRDLVNQIQDKSIQLSDLEIILEDYQHERQALLREIGQLKASLWELSAEASLPARTPRANPSSNQTGDQPAA